MSTIVENQLFLTQENVNKETLALLFIRNSMFTQVGTLLVSNIVSAFVNLQNSVNHFFLNEKKQKNLSDKAHTSDM